MKENKKVDETTAKTSQTVEESKFSVKDLKIHSQDLFGISPEVFEGLFSQRTNEVFSKSEAKEIIDKWLKEEVK